MILVRDIIEKGVAPAEVNKYKCRHSCGSDPILGELGGAPQAKIALAHLKLFLGDFADKREHYCFFVAIGGEVVVEVEAHCDLRLRLWDLQSYWIRDSTVLKDMHLIVTPAKLPAER